MSTAPRSGAAPARSSISRRRRCASGTPRVWIPTSATRERSGFASMISCAIRDSVRRSASASRRTVPDGASTMVTALAGSTVCGRVASYDSFPASLDRLKGVRVVGETLNALPDGAPETRPLRGIEVTRPCLPGETELGLTAFQSARRHGRPQAAAIASREERLIGGTVRCRDERLPSPNDPEHAGVDRRLRRKDGSRQPTGERELKPGAPVRAELRAGPHRGPLRRHVPLDDHIGALQQRSWIEQPPQDRRGTSERQIGDNLEPLARERDAQQVVLDDSNLGKPPPEAGGQFGVDLDRDHERSTADERCGQSTSTGAEVKDDVVPPDPGSANELRGELATAEKVLAAAARSRSNGHGRPPRT